MYNIFTMASATAMAPAPAVGCLMISEMFAVFVCTLMALSIGLVFVLLAMALMGD